jgi:hypothetical protein
MTGGEDSLYAAEYRPAASALVISGVSRETTAAG